MAAAHDQHLPELCTDCPLQLAVEELKTLPLGHSETVGLTYVLYFNLHCPYKTISVMCYT